MLQSLGGRRGGGAYSRRTRARCSLCLCRPYHPLFYRPLLTTPQETLRDREGLSAEGVQLAAGVLPEEAEAAVNRLTSLGFSRTQARNGVVTVK